jgi:hypothetical protein
VSAAELLPWANLLLVPLLAQSVRMAERVAGLEAQVRILLDGQRADRKGATA